MSISGLDLNLVHRAGSGRGGLVMIAAPDTICGKAHPAGELLRRPIQVAPDKNSVPMEGDPSRPYGPAVIPHYGPFRLDQPAGARIDLLC
jgi:hypothetical protein